MDGIGMWHKRDRTVVGRKENWNAPDPASHWGGLLRETRVHYAFKGLVFLEYLFLVLNYCLFFECFIHLYNVY